MSHVTDRLAELECQMMQLVRWREFELEELAKHRTALDAVFDAAALELGRQINELKEQLPKPDPSTKPKVKRIEIMCLDGLTDAEKEHFKKLLDKSKG